MVALLEGKTICWNLYVLMFMVLTSIDSSRKNHMLGKGLLSIQQYWPIEKIMIEEMTMRS